MGLKLLIILLVLLAGLFIAAVYIGSRPDKLGGTGANDGQGWKIKKFAQASVPSDEIVCSCLNGKQLVVQKDCVLVVTETKSRFGVRTLRLKITVGTAQAQWKPDGSDADNPGEIKMDLTAADAKKSEFRVPVLRHGGTLTLTNRGPVNSPAKLEMVDE